MNGCISTNLEVVPTDSPQLTVYSGVRPRERSEDENGSRVREWFEVSSALILTLNLILLKFIFEAHVMLG